MRNKLFGGCFLTTALVAACLAGNVGRGQGQPVPPGSEVALPPSIVPGTPLAEVVKLAQVGVDPGIIKAYIANATGTFNLDADKIIALTDLGVTSDLVNAMMDHDKNLAAGVMPTVVAPPPTALSPTEVTDDSSIAAPPTEVDVNYFNNTLTPYGSWVVVEGYGRCWRPTTVIYDASWQPYCDRGHWVYSNFGWYWDSDYSWGVTFHYGRWFHHDRFGWCWWPDTTWAPSWVTWRQSDAYCGWAPLPPFAEYRPGAGFFYRGANVAVGFDFGIDPNYFTFVPAGNFCDRRLRPYRVDAVTPAKFSARPPSSIISATTIISSSTAAFPWTGSTRSRIAPSGRWTSGPFAMPVAQAGADPSRRKIAPRGTIIITISRAIKIPPCATFTTIMPTRTSRQILISGTKV